MAPPQTGPPLDEIQFRGPIPQGGIHSNSVLWYFTDSPFYDPQSNNAIVISQGMSNANMVADLMTREAFERRLKTMSGLEFIVAQEPSEMAPGTGTGVWVINKQTRRKRIDQEDEVTVHATYFIVGENIYMAPSVADIMSSRIATISNSINKAINAADEVQKWSSARGRVYANPTPSGSTRPKGLDSKEATPMPGADVTTNATTTAKPVNRTALDARLAEESLALHMRYGGEYMDTNPITGQPGSFHLTSTGRKDANAKAGALSVPVGAAAKGGAGGDAAASLSLKDAANTLPPLDTKVAAENPLARTGKETKSPRSGAPKPKRRKSKGGTATPTASAPNTPTAR